MKKEYIVPECKLFAMNISENIADSIGSSSEIQGTAVIQFYQYIDGCRGIYTKTETAPVNPNNSTFLDYYNDMLQYGAEVHYNCFRYQILG